MENTRDLEVLIIGAGFGGLAAARSLRERGVSRITILERADRIGGVWRDNTYPGAACDVPSPLYSWSWAPNPHWGRRYSPQPEILAYIEQNAEREGLSDLVVTGVEVTSATFDDATHRWLVGTAGGASYEADVVISAVGQLSNPVIPNLPGRDTFAGPAFHSAEWRHDVDLTGQRVAVIGTGASAIQFVPGIVEDAGAITVFQRSAPYVVPKPDQEYRERHHRAFDRWPGLPRGERRFVFWLSEKLNAALEGQARWSKGLLATMRTSWRLNLRRHIKDPALRAKLTPDYEIGCKRILFSNHWYPALAQPHADVVTDAVAAVEPGGVRDANGVLHEADVLIWGTGFAATDFLSGIDVTGREGRTLAESWRDGARAYRGVAIAGFPNFFCIYGPNTNLGGSSIIGMMEAQAGWIAAVVARLQGGSATVEVTQAAYDTYDAEMQSRLQNSVWSTCSSWYRDGDRITTNWPGQVGEYQGRLAAVDWSDLEVR